MSKPASAPPNALEGKLIDLMLPNRGPDSYFAGSATMASTLGRRPEDYDIHHRTPSALARAIACDRQAIEAVRGRCLIYKETRDEVKGRLELDGARVEIDWVLDEASPILGPVPDDDWGYRLHPFDVSVHKILQAAECGMPKDLVDLLNIHERLFSLAAIAWAAPLRDGETKADRVLARVVDWWRLRASTMVELRRRLMHAELVLSEARNLCSRLPPEQAGCLFLRSSIFPVDPTPDGVGLVAIRPIQTAAAAKIRSPS